MRRVVGWISWGFLGVGAVLLAASWLDQAPELGADDAIEVAVDALETVGARATPSETAPAQMVHEPKIGGSPVDAWRVVLAVDAQETIEVRVQRTVGQLVYVDDRIGPDDQERYLTDDQFDRLRDYRDDSLVFDWIIRNVAATIALLAGGVLLVVLTRRAPTLEDQAS